MKKITFPCLLGMLEWEQSQPQALGIDVSLNLDLDQAAGGDLTSSINYAVTLEDLQFLAQHGRWRLLESMAAAMARHLLAAPEPGEERAQVEALVLELAKPEVFGGRAVPSVAIHRSKDWAALTYRALSDAPGVRGAVLQATADVGAYRIVLEPQARWTAPPGMALRVLAGALEVDGTRVATGGSVARGGARLLNPGSVPCRLLGVAQPPLAAAV